jgi:hypothetical protein
MIEILIILLSSENRQLALQVLSRFQEVAFDYNQGLKQD